MLDESGFAFPIMRKWSPPPMFVSLVLLLLLPLLVLLLLCDLFSIETLLEDPTLLKLLILLIHPLFIVLLFITIIPLLPLLPLQAPPPPCDVADLVDLTDFGVAFDDAIVLLCENMDPGVIIIVSLLKV